MEVGRQVKSHRRRAQFRSQRAFAEVLGVGESSVANVERGSDRVGDGPVYEAIETRFSWPVGSITAYIAGTGPAPWTMEVAPTAAHAEPASSGDPVDDWTPEEVAQMRGMTVDEIIVQARTIGRFSGEEAQLRYLRKAATVRLESPIAPPR